MQEKTRDALRKAFFEAFFVVFGVVLALAANEWRQNAAAERHAARALGNIESELGANRAKVVASRDYHHELVAMLSERMKTGEPSRPGDFGRGFVCPALVEDTAWEVAKETGALATMDYQLVLELSAIYGSQERYRKQAETIGAMIYRKMLEGGIEAVSDHPRNLMSVIYTFVYREEGLVAEYAPLLGEMPAPAEGE